MPGDVKVEVVTVALATGATDTTNFIKAGFGTPKAWIIFSSADITDNNSPQDQSRMSIGFGDGAGNFCISHVDEHASAKVDSDAVKSNTKSYIIATPAGITIDGTSAAIIDGVQLTNTSNVSNDAPFVTVVIFGGDDFNFSLDSVTTPNDISPPGDTVQVTTNIDQSLVFFIGTDISGEDSISTGINNSFGVVHINPAHDTFTNRSIGWASDHNNTVGTPSSELCNDRCLNIITESGTADWGLSVTAADATSYTLTEDNSTSGNGMEIYALALDLGRGAGVENLSTVFSVDGPTAPGTFSITGMGFKPQYVGLALTDLSAESAARAGIATDAEAGVHGISSIGGTGAEACHSWYNEDAAATTNTATTFRSRAVFLADHDTTTIVQDHSFLAFTNDGVDLTINAEDETVAKKWFGWGIENSVKDRENLEALCDGIMGEENFYAGPFEVV